MATQSDQLFYSSLVTEHIVPKGKNFAFRRWHTRLVDRAKHSPGFLQADLCPPLRCRDPVVKWYSIVHFDSPAHLNDWIESADRKRLVELGQPIFQAYRFKSFTTGLEGWFSQQAGPAEQSGLGPPTWKQILAVVVGLYPIVMLQSKLLTALGIFQGWSSASAMLVNNLMTSVILSLVVMPFVSKRLRFWLRPAYHPASRKNDAIGIGIVISALVSMMLVFQQF